MTTNPASPRTGHNRHRYGSLASAAVAGLLLTACSGDGDSRAQSPGSSTSDPSEVAETFDTGIHPLGEPDLEKKTHRPEVAPELTVTDIRMGHHKDFDRVVFEFSGTGSPGWHIDYNQHPNQQASGNSVRFHGRAALEVRIDGTRISEPSFHPGAGPLEGPDDSNIAQLITTGNAEERTQFIIGLDRKVPYSVTYLRNPSRLVIDLVP